MQLVVSSVAEHALSVRKVRGLNPAPVESDTVSPTDRQRCDVSSELCCSGAKLYEVGPHHSLYTLRRNTASIIL